MGQNPKGNDRIPSINFQGAFAVSFREGNPKPTKLGLHRSGDKRVFFHKQFSMTPKMLEHFVLMKYCWWKKSQTTTWHVKNGINYVNYQSQLVSSRISEPSTSMIWLLLSSSHLGQTHTRTYTSTTLTPTSVHETQAGKWGSTGGRMQNM